MCVEIKQAGNPASQQTQNICIAFVQRKANVFDVDPTLYKCYTNALCMLGYLYMRIVEPGLSILPSENPNKTWLSNMYVRRLRFGEPML